MMPQVVYTAESQLRRPRQFLRRMAADLLASRELAWRLLLRDIRAQYRRTLLGYLWVFLPPLFTTLIWSYLHGARVLRVETTEITYPLYVLVGTLLWQGFVDALNAPLRQLAASQSMLTKLSFPWEAIVIAGLGKVSFNFAIRLVLVLIMFAAFRIHVPVTILLAPLGMLALLALGSALGLLLAPLGLLYQDVRRGINLVTTLWFFVTPVVYPPPTTWPASLVATLNPVTPLLVATRELMTTGTISGQANLVWVVGLTPFLLTGGWVFHRLAMPHLIARLSAR